MRYLQVLIWFLVCSGALAQDSSRIKQKVMKVFPQGNISVGYDYGFLPFLVQNNPPVGNFKTDGHFQIQLKSLPFQASYYYSSLGTISGLNNHFTIRFDAQKYKQQMLEKLKLNELNRIGDIDSLGKVKQNLKTKLDYLYLVKDRKIALPIDSSKYNFPDLPSSWDLPDISTDLDSLDGYGEIKDTSLIDISIDTPDVSMDLPTFDMDQYMDSVSNEIGDIQSRVSGIEERVEDLKRLANLSQDSLMQLELEKIKSPWMRKLNGLMGNVKRLDIGLTYPNYSKFLIARIPVRGINLEYQKKKFYLALTHGKTVNNIFFTNNIIQNNLNAARNLYNFFDFNNVNDGRRVTALQLGIGQKKATHIHIGFLYGLGKVSYQDTSLIVDQERNLVGEVDAGLKIKKSHFLSFNYGRSAVQVNGINLGEESGLLDRFLDVNDRTNALLGRYQLKSKNTELALTFRWVDPYFRSFGVGFLRSDNIRYEVKLKQKFGKKFGVNGYFRRENDNLLGLYSYQNVLMSYGVGMSFRPNKHWMVKIDLRPIVLDATSEVDSLSVMNNNLIVNGVVNYNNRIQDTYLNLTGVYSFYQLTIDEGTQEYQNINVNGILEGKHLSNTLIFNHYRTTDTSSVPLASLLQNDLTYKWNKVSLTGSLKGSLAQNKQFDFGYGVSVRISLHKGLSFAASFDKLVIGDFYNNIYNSNLLDFPYRMTSSLILRW